MEKELKTLPYHLSHLSVCNLDEVRKNDIILIDYNMLDDSVLGLGKEIIVVIDSGINEDRISYIIGKGLGYIIYPFTKNKLLEVIGYSDK